MTLPCLHDVPHAVLDRRLEGDDVVVEADGVLCRQWSRRHRPMTVTVGAVATQPRAAYGVRRRRTCPWHPGSHAPQLWPTGAGRSRRRPTRTVAVCVSSQPGSENLIEAVANAGERVEREDRCVENGPDVADGEIDGLSRTENAVANGYRDYVRNVVRCPDSSSPYAWEAVQSAAEELTVTTVSGLTSPRTNVHE